MPATVLENHSGESFGVLERVVVGPVLGRMLGRGEDGLEIFVSRLRV